MNFDDGQQWVVPSAAVVELVCFGIVVVALFYEICTTKRGQIGSLSIQGTYHRACFLISLLLANCFRFGFIVMHVFLYKSKQTSEPLLSTQIDILFREVPSWFYLATYSIGILFWLETYYISFGYRTILLRRLCFFLNVLPIFIFSLTAVITLEREAWHVFRLVSMFLIGFFYMVTCYLWTFSIWKMRQLLFERSYAYSQQCLLSLSKDSLLDPPNCYNPLCNDYHLSTNPCIDTRLRVLGTVCSLSFGLRGVYNLLGALIYNQYYIFYISHTIWDAVVFLSTDFVPSLCILYAFWSFRHTVEYLDYEDICCGKDSRFYKLDDGTETGPHSFN
ncbi:hypothetical protein IE077_001792 [Cardiosporidium cionae]|uniref:Uncharacterized protein n=1 Tax=Cardiosporidium cionae TaxID=476202 RepID=A0ABQ7J502_9APIC|nr:hypothetical protein IE077_001792 [Cardiosporidium cionae]|eukprot:KAF8819052.1 hypothetical protein IE077_001792 [Cardiosporidium cionae]